MLDILRVIPENQVMALAQEDIQYIKDHIGEWLSDLSLAKPPAVYEVELRERMVRVEEELKHQRELMMKGFEQSDKRFEQVDKRFEQMDQRFEVLTRRIDRFMIWSFSITISTAGIIIAVLKFT